MRVIMRGPTESTKRHSRKRSLSDRRLVVFLEVTVQPPRSDALMPARILPRDQSR